MVTSVPDSVSHLSYLKSFSLIQESEKKTRRPLAAFCTRKLVPPPSSQPFPQLGSEAVAYSGHFLSQGSFPQSQGLTG